jgi:hypothetical protein
MSTAAAIRLPPEPSPGRLWYPPIRSRPGLPTDAVCAFLDDESVLVLLYKPL